MDPLRLMDSGLCSCRDRCHVAGGRASRAGCDETQWRDWTDDSGGRQERLGGGAGLSGWAGHGVSG